MLNHKEVKLLRRELKVNVDRKESDVAYALYQKGEADCSLVWKEKIRKKIESVKYTSPTKAETMKAEEVAEVQRGILSDLLGE